MSLSFALSRARGAAAGTTIGVKRLRGSLSWAQSASPSLGSPSPAVSGSGITVPGNDQAAHFLSSPPFGLAMDVQKRGFKTRERMRKIWDRTTEDDVYAWAREKEIERKTKQAKLSAPRKRGHNTVREYNLRAVKKAKQASEVRKNIANVSAGDAVEIVHRPWKSAKAVHRDYGVVIAVSRRSIGLFLLLTIFCMGRK